MVLLECALNQSYRDGGVYGIGELELILIVYKMEFTVEVLVIDWVLGLGSF